MSGKFLISFILVFLFNYEAIAVDRSTVIDNISVLRAHIMKVKAEQKSKIATMQISANYEMEKKINEIFQKAVDCVSATKGNKNSLQKDFMTTFLQTTNSQVSENNRNLDNFDNKYADFENKLRDCEQDDACNSPEYLSELSNDLARDSQQIINIDEITKRLDELSLVKLQNSIHSLVDEKVVQPLNKCIHSFQ